MKYININYEAQNETFTAKDVINAIIPAFNKFDNISFDRTEDININGAIGCDCYFNIYGQSNIQLVCRVIQTMHYDITFKLVGSCLTSIYSKTFSFDMHETSGGVYVYTFNLQLPYYSVNNNLIILNTHNSYICMMFSKDKDNNVFIGNCNDTNIVYANATKNKEMYKGTRVDLLGYKSVTTHMNDKCIIRDIVLSDSEDIFLVPDIKSLNCNYATETCVDCVIDGKEYTRFGTLVAM